MPAELHALLSDDHDRLDALLASCLREDGTVVYETYDAFRRGLLRHIAIEERVLFPQLRKRSGETALERQLHRDHAALAALLVPPPSAAGIERIREVLTTHNPLEENAGGLYDLLEDIAGAELKALIAAVRSVPAVPVAPHADTQLVRDTIEQLLRQRAE